MVYFLLFLLFELRTVALFLPFWNRASGYMGRKVFISLFGSATTLTAETIPVAKKLRYVFALGGTDTPLVLLIIQTEDVGRGIGYADLDCTVNAHMQSPNQRFPQRRTRDVPLTKRERVRNVFSLRSWES